MRFFLLFLLSLSLFADYAIVFVHLGESLPPFQQDSIAQARLFNPNCPIYLVASESALKEFPKTSAIKISCESLAKSHFHTQYLKETPTSGFWNFVVERFFYLEELMSQHGLSSIFHLENDVMLYCNLETDLPIFQSDYQGMIAATFDNDSRCIPGFLYIDSIEPLSKWVAFIASKASAGINDMALFGQFRALYYKKAIDHLPIAPNVYGELYPLETYQGTTVKRAADYSNHFDRFQSIFDAAAFGQYLGGQDPIHQNAAPGFINESCVFNPARFSIEWKKDTEGRWIPIGRFQEKTFPINNLHIHSKRLSSFSSLLKQPPYSISSFPTLEKKRFPLSADPIDAVLVANERNRSFLESAVESLRLHTKVRRIVVISPEPWTAEAEWFDSKQFPFSASQIVEAMFANSFEKRRYPYHPRNQLHKIFAHLASLYAPLLIPNLSPNVLVIEPEVLFLHEIDLMTEMGEPLFNVRDKYEAAHKTLSVRLLPHMFFENYVEITHFVLMQKPILEELFDDLQEIHGEPWRAICRMIDLGKIYDSPFSAFSLYGSFAIARTAQAKFKPLKGVSSFYIYDLPKYQKEGCDFIYRSR